MKTGIPPAVPAIRPACSDPPTAYGFRPIEPAVSPLFLREKQIQKTVCDLLRAEGWRVFEFEQQFSEKKRSTVGEKGMPDVLGIRYSAAQLRDFMTDLPWKSRGSAEVLWIEMKRIDKRGRTTKARADQKLWHEAERARGALVWVAGEDFPATIDGFIAHYKASGLARR